MTEEQSGRQAALSEGAALSAPEERVARARVAFSASLHEASLAGRETVERAAWVVRPLLVGAGILAGAVVVTHWWRGKRRPRELPRSLALALAAVAARHLAERWLDRQPRRASRRAAGSARA